MPKKRDPTKREYRQSAEVTHRLFGELLSFVASENEVKKHLCKYCINPYTTVMYQIFVR